jgi:hypothetical protein
LLIISGECLTKAERDRLNRIERTFSMKKRLRFTALFLLLLVSACRTGEQIEISAAIESDNTQEVMRLLASGSDINARDRDDLHRCTLRQIQLKCL